MGARSIFNNLQQRHNPPSKPKPQVPSVLNIESPRPEASTPTPLSPELAGAKWRGGSEGVDPYDSPQVLLFLLSRPLSTSE